ncbi:hypothetical protein OVA14_02655 [Agrococcus sp. SL85]|uniref:hypothetical protein n=1 Tax=Agrococcus sp. SL85 TaxID=2995141 RepID=UPI00226C94E8|nr:hypothetical protein [Agrococcus sp. SL85]WAC66695.1 hypothetical protein OVA14_02655 [Agrococcus sp. SL85]
MPDHDDRAGSARHAPHDDGEAHPGEGQAAFVDDATGRSFARAVAEGEVVMAETRAHIEELEHEREHLAPRHDEGARPGDPGPHEEVEPE